ncbi:MAG: glycosyltransferase family 4 protein [Planctomycetaceae bacterium]|nr:glycosyltransferase family 4 protein [Planctomycetaceae bacterium]
MKAPRVVLVSRRFWPSSDDDAALATRMATSFVDRGWPTTVITQTGQAHWPASYDHNGVRVERLLRPARGWLSVWNQRHAVLRWFEQQRATFDVVVPLGLNDDAALVIEASKRLRFPVVSRVLQVGPGGECHQQMHTSAGMRLRRACAKSDVVVAASELAERELIAAGYPRDRIRLITPGITLPEPRRADARSAIRAALSTADPGLNLPENAWLALHSLHAARPESTMWLLQVWRTVVAHHPRAWLWLLGSAEQQLWARRQLQELNLLGRVMPIGAFDDVQDFFLAADAFIEPGPTYEPPLFMLQAMAAELPVIAVAGNEGVPESGLPVIDGRSGRRIPPQNVEALLAAIEQIEQRPAWSHELGCAGRQIVEQRFRVEAEMEAYARLFDKLRAAR